MNKLSFQQRANTQKIPSDLDRWFSNTNNCDQLFTDLGFSLLTDSEILSIRNPNQMDFKDDATYFSHKEVLSQIIFVSKNKYGVYFGYFLGYDSLLSKAPLVAYRKTFELLTYSLTESLILDIINQKSNHYYLNEEDEKKYNLYKQQFENYDFEIRDFDQVTTESDELYNKHTDPDELLNTLKNGRDLSHLSSHTSDDIFLEWGNPRFGINNPTLIKSPLWENAIYSKEDAYSIANKYNKHLNSPIWCFSRFGQSITRVNGKEIFIAGEHEDYYDPDFHIYNDVVVVNNDNSIEIYNYPKDVFPPTDFHSATLINDHTIFIIGSLGYLDERQINSTPVYVLNIDNFKIEKVLTTGNNPGWIYKHRAILSDDKSSIKIIGGIIHAETNLTNIDEWTLNLKTCEWRRLTKK